MTDKKKKNENKKPPLYLKLKKYSIDALHNGDERILSDIVNIYGELFTGYIRVMMGKNRTETAVTAEDIFQQALIGFWKNRRNVMDIPSIQPYLYRAVVNNFINQYNREKKFQPESLGDSHKIELIPGTRSAEKWVEAKEQICEIQEFVEEMSPDRQEAFRLFVGGMKYTEAAEEMDIPLGTYKSTIYFIRKEIQKKYACED